MEAKGFIERTFEGMRIRIFSNEDPVTVMAMADSQPQIEGVNPMTDFEAWQTYHLTTSAIGFLAFESNADLMNFRSHHHRAFGAESALEIYTEALVTFNGSGLVILRHGAEDRHPEMSNTDLFDLYLNVFSSHWEDQ